MQSGFFEVLDYLRQLNLASMLLRLSLSLLFGGLIGIERERKRRPAGFRTYMLVCMGAALTMILSQYLSLMLSTRWADAAAAVGARSDVSRMGAQVISGIGFLGAGTILITGRQEVKGLTTAAGLWASACMGLAIGAGFYECTLLAFLLIFLIVKVFPRIEAAALAKSRTMSLYVEFRSLEDFPATIQAVKSLDIQIFDVDLERGKEDSLGRPNAVLSVTLPRRQSHTGVLTELSKLDSVYAIEEL